MYREADRFVLEETSTRSAVQTVWDAEDDRRHHSVTRLKQSAVYRLPVCTAALEGEFIRCFGVSFISCSNSWMDAAAEEYGGVQR